MFIISFGLFALGTLEIPYAKSSVSQVGIFSWQPLLTNSITTKKLSALKRYKSKKMMLVIS